MSGAAAGFGETEWERGEWKEIETHARSSRLRPHHRGAAAPRGPSVLHCNYIWASCRSLTFFFVNLTVVSFRTRLTIGGLLGSTVSRPWAPRTITKGQF